MAWTYYIDGYNVIHHSAVLKPLAETDLEAARDALVEKAARFVASAAAPVVVVFDGRGRASGADPAAGDTPGLEVVYSGGGRSADAVIERRVYAAEDRRHIVVVTADRGIRDVCLALGSLVMAPDKFLATVRETRDRIAWHLEQARQAYAADPIEDRLDEPTRQRLRELRDELS